MTLLSNNAFILSDADGLSDNDRTFINKSMGELRQAFTSLAGIRLGISVLGSARCKPEDALYQKTLKVMRKISDAFLARRVPDFAFMTGGGGCVMSAGLEAVPESATAVGLNITLQEMSRTRQGWVKIAIKRVYDEPSNIETSKRKMRNLG